MTGDVMKKFVIITDSTSDLEKGFQEKYGIVLLNGHLVLPDGQEVPSRTEWVEFTRDEYYGELKKNPEGFKTSPPNVQEYYEAFRKYTSEGAGILAITISGGISGSYGFMCAAREQLVKEQPEAEIFCIDSRRFGPSIGLLCIYASLFRAGGMDLAQTYQAVESLKDRLHQAGWMDDLSFVAKKGRITHASAFMGTLVGIKPLGEFDSNGLTTVIGKVKGARTAYRTLLEYIARTIENPQDQIIFLAHSCREKQAEEFRDMIVERFHPKEIYVNEVYQSCGANIGPGLMAAYYVGKAISPDLSGEKTIMNQIITGE